MEGLNIRRNLFSTAYEVKFEDGKKAEFKCYTNVVSATLAKIFLRVHLEKKTYTDGDKIKVIYIDKDKLTNFLIENRLEFLEKGEKIVGMRTIGKTDDQNEKKKIFQSLPNNETLEGFRRAIISRYQTYKTERLSETTLKKLYDGLRIPPNHFQGNNNQERIAAFVKSSRKELEELIKNKKEGNWHPKADEQRILEYVVGKFKFNPEAPIVIDEELIDLTEQEENDESLKKISNEVDKIIEDLRNKTEVSEEDLMNELERKLLGLKALENLTEDQVHTKEMILEKVEEFKKL